MESNLHNAILLPAEGVMILANAASGRREGFQACYQPYYRYELATLVATLDALQAAHQPEGHSRVAVSTLAFTKPAKVAATTQPASHDACVTAAANPSSDACAGVATSQTSASMTAAWEHADGVAGQIALPTNTGEANTTATTTRASTEARPAQKRPDENRSADARRVIRGEVPASTYRPLRRESDPKLAAMLKRYENRPEAFSYTMRPMMESEGVTMWSVTFASPIVGKDVETNTVWCEYFQSHKPGPRPAVVVLHLLANNFAMPRIIAQSLATAGVDAMMVKLPYYAERRPKDPARAMQMHKDLDVLQRGVVQAVCDVRRAMQFLSVQNGVDRERIGLCGVSLGALITALTIGVDGNVPTAVIIMGGVNLAEIIATESRETNGMRAYLAEHKIGREKLTRMLRPIEPMTYISRAKGTRVMMVNAAQDHIIPPTCTEALMQQLDRPQVQSYPANHYTMTVYLLDALQKVERFLLTTPTEVADRRRQESHTAIQ